MSSNRNLILVSLIWLSTTICNAQSSEQARANMDRAIQNSKAGLEITNRKTLQLSSENADLMNLINGEIAGSSTSNPSGVAQPLLATGAKASSATSSCAARAQMIETIEADFTKRFNAVPADNQVRRLGLLYSVTTTVSEIWLPCNPAKAKSYKDTADGTLKTCKAIANTPSACSPNIVWNENADGIRSQQQVQRERADDLSETAQTLKQIGGMIADHQRDKAERASPRPAAVPGKRACSPTCGVQ